MKALIKIACFLMVGVIFLSSCGPRPAYKTAKGKKKLKYYNSIQYEQKKDVKKKW